MKHYVKIISATQLQFAPKPATYNGTYYSDVPDEVNEAQGYTEYIQTPMPDVPDAEHHVEFVYQIVDGKITEVWTVVADDPADICARLREYLNDTDKYYIQWQEGDKTDEQYEPYRVARQAARERIRELENEIRGKALV